MLFVYFTHAFLQHFLHILQAIILLTGFKIFTDIKKDRIQPIRAIPCHIFILPLRFRVLQTPHDLKVEGKNYELKYEGEWTEGMHLEGIYTKFNIDRPEDFTGHSLSVGDIVVLNRDGKETAHFVDSVGFVEVPEFFLESVQEQTREEVAESIEDGDEIIDLGDDREAVLAQIRGSKEVDVQDTSGQDVQKQKPEVEITLTVAECGEFHNMGEFYENIPTVEEAIALTDEETGIIYSTKNFIVNIDKTAVDNSEIASSDEFDALNNLISTNKKLNDELNANEEIRKANENERIKNENLRINNENTRENNELSRQDAEAIRVENENERIVNENTRKSNEIIRQNQETDRQTNTATAIANANVAAQNANDKANDLQNKLDSHHFVLTEDKDVAGGVPSPRFSAVSSTASCVTPAAKSLRLPYRGDALSNGSTCRVLT